MDAIALDDDLLLRPAVPGDAPSLFALVDGARRRAGRFHPWWTDLATVDDARYWCERGWPDRDSLLIVRGAEAEVLGVCSLGPVEDGAAALSWWVPERDGDLALATRAGAAVARHAFEAEGVRRLRYRCAEDDARAMAFARALGFTVESQEMEPAYYAPGGYRTWLHHAVNAETLRSP